MGQVRVESAILSFRKLCDAVAKCHASKTPGEAEKDREFLVRAGVATSGDAGGTGPTRIELLGCVVEDCSFAFCTLEYPISVGAVILGNGNFRGARFQSTASFAQSLFVGRCNFNQARFSRTVGFDRCRFAGRASFGGAKFEHSVTFRFARFHCDTSFLHLCASDLADFTNVCFASTVSFRRSRFEQDVHFEESQFFGCAHFESVRFVTDAWFGGATFAGLIEFSNAEVCRRLLLSGVKFRARARLRIHNIVVRAGASVHLNPEQLAGIESRRSHLARWMRRRRAVSEKWAMAPMSWTLTIAHYLEAAIVCPFGLDRAFRTTCLWFDDLSRRSGGSLGPHDNAFGLGIGLRGRLIEGEDSDDKGELARAAEAYNLLRDTFRAQPSTDVHEEICAVRYHDLLRRARPRPSGWSYIPCFFHWLVMRNALGYLINPWRPVITGLLLILFFAGVYHFGINVPGIIGHGNFQLHEAQAALDYWKHDWLNPLYLSLMTFVTLGYGDFQPTAGWLKLVTGIEGILGVTLLALFTVAWGRKMVR